MRKQFNAEGICFAADHYMVNLDSRIMEIKKLISDGKYFTINKARQYGKTTTLSLLKESLDDEYIVFSISFEGIGDKAYQDEYSFCRLFCGLLYDAIFYKEVIGVSKEIENVCKQMSEDRNHSVDFRELSNFITKVCQQAEKSVILIIDEVDQASDQKIFLDFLGMLRAKYLKRNSRPTFSTVVLASVYDIKNLKKKIRTEDKHQYNSPWNIASDFNIDMSFSINDIGGMLSEYEMDYQWGIDIVGAAKLIYEFTSGYPYLVSRLCKIIDERLIQNDKWNAKSAWTREGILEAVKILVREPSTLFDDIRKKLDDFPSLRNVLEEILFKGSQMPYNQYNQVMDIGVMFGFLKEENHVVVIANRIFEIFLYNLFISEQALQSTIYQKGDEDKKQFLKNGKLDMELILAKFVDHFTEIYGDNDCKFVEENGRRLFLLYLKPIINGTGNYYIETQTRDRKRTDIIVDYLGEQYILELKIWHGEEYNQRGEKQLLEYLEFYHVNKGYMISFNFNKNKMVGVHELQFGDKCILEAVV